MEAEPKMSPVAGEELSRRGVLAGAGAAPLAGARGKPRRGRVGAVEVVVVGAGVFGAWTAERLRLAGKQVLLLDAWGPAHARASSGGESRIMRTAYGADDIYTRMAWESLAEWKRLSAPAEPPLFHPIGILFFFPSKQPYALQSIEAHKRLALPLAVLDAGELARRYPQADWAGVEMALFEPGRGALMARRALQTLVDGFLRGGGQYRRAAVKPPGNAATLHDIETLTGERISAESFVFA